MPDLRPGYLVKITTWENDADNEKTVERDGLTEAQARFLIRAAQLFNSKNSANPGFGNCNRKSDADLPDRLEALVAEHKVQYGNEGIPEYWDVDTWAAEAEHDEYREDYTRDVFYDLIGMWNEGEYWRVFTRFEVFLVPEAIRNVTEDFKA